MPDVFNGLKEPPRSCFYLCSRCVHSIRSLAGTIPAGFFENDVLSNLNNLTRGLSYYKFLSANDASAQNIQCQVSLWTLAIYDIWFEAVFP